MSLNPADLDHQERLKRELQDDKKASEFENLIAALLGRLLGVPIAVAKSGFQHGGDGGPAGRQDRRFRLECKKYSDRTNLSDRELLGEIDHALLRDEALEAWILAATRSVPEQLAQELTLKGERIGVPIVIIDWNDHELAPLAALCAFDPDLVEKIFSAEAGTLARALQPVSGASIEMLRRELQSWCLGFSELRTRSHEKLQRIWNSPRTSNSEIGQNAAGGAQEKKIKRNTVHNALSAWWHGPARNDAPAAVIGWDGVGKTWAVLDWLIDNRSEQPVVLIVPSSAVAGLSSVSETSVKRFLADRLYELSGVRDHEHWIRRLEYLLKRPAGEGVALTVFFDGVNQESSVSWLSFLKVLQGEAFERRVRVLVSTRTYHFEVTLAKLRGLIVPAVLVNVERYDASPGGELDQMLALEGLTQADLHSDLIELARTPRLFKLVVQFRERLVEAGQVTVHRLLWEYGRDTFGERAGKSFSEAEWQAWLKEIAGRYREGVREFSPKSLSETASRPDLTEREVYARLSDIIDGQFAKPTPSGNLQLTPTVVAHALGAALLAHLDAIAQPTFENVESELTLWLDPIGGLDERAEILRAAVSILVERGGPASSTPLASVLVTAWLQSQNITDNHRHELTSLAPNLTDALLDAVERSYGPTHASARLWAVNALRAIPRSNSLALTVIVTRLRAWFGTVALGLGTSAEHDKHRRDRFVSRIGTDASGPITVLGVNIKITDRADHVLAAMGPSILDGFPLANAKSVFEAAAIALAVAGYTDGWDGLKWLCLVNKVDSHETAVALRDLSEEIRLRPPESGVHSQLPARVAALVLWLTGEEMDEDIAPSIDPGIDRVLSYEKDYLPFPGPSLLPLERRHAATALTDTELPFHVRVGRTKELWLDPNFEPPPAFVAEVREAVARIDVEKLYRNNSYTIEDHNFEDIEPVLARCAPDLLADLICRRIQSAATCPVESRYWMAISTTDHLLLAGEAEASAAKTMRLKEILPENHAAYAANKLLMLELRDVDAQAQFDALIKADLEFVSDEFAEILRPPTPADVDALIARYGAGSPKQQRDLLILLSIHPVSFSENAWSWIEGFARDQSRDLHGVAFKTLTGSNSKRFGRSLALDGWAWRPDADLWVNHYGSGALIESTLGQPFDQIAPRIAPWRLLEAVRLRGADPNEVRLAAGILGHVLAAEKIEEPDPGSILWVNRTGGKSSPGEFSVQVSPTPILEDDKDPVAALNAVMDADVQRKTRRRAVETAVARVNEAWRSGASLYLADMSAEDFKPVLECAPDMIDRWLEGLHEITGDFRRRVHLAGPAFLALCEALLPCDPVRGAQLWRALRAILTTRYMGAAGVEDLLHMIFRVPDSAEVNELREELIQLEHCNTDQAVFDLAVAASYNGKADWLDRSIQADRASAFAWKRRRGAVLSGFTVNNRLPVADAWPNGQIGTSYADLDRRSARFRWIEACAHHWWQVYLAALEPTEAYAAWILFLRSADHRAWIWMQEDIRAANNDSPFFKLKLRYAQLNRSKLKRAIEKRSRNLDNDFLDRRIVKDIGPWSRRRSRDCHRTDRREAGASATVRNLFKSIDADARVFGQLGKTRFRTAQTSLRIESSSGWELCARLDR